MSFIVPAVLSPSRDDLEKKLRLFSNTPGVERVQIDVVDGQFATPASWPYTSPEDQRALKTHDALLPDLGRIEYEIDLMCLDTEAAADWWLRLGAARLTIHAEAAVDLGRLLDALQKRHGRDAVAYGLALNIASELVRIEPYLDRIDYVQFMGIATIGRQAQSFDKRVLSKISAFRTAHPDVPVQVDGGVSLRSAPQLSDLGVSNLISGSAILKAPNPAAAFRQLEEQHRTAMTL